MPHVVFIHGLANKPPLEALHAQWTSALAGADQRGLDLAKHGVTCESVYWADVMYANPEAATSEGEDILAGSPAAADRDPGPSRAWQTTLPPDEQEFADRLRTRLEEAAKEVRTDIDDPTLAPADRAFPLPRPIERLLMERLVRDAHHYLYASEFEPRPGERFNVQRELRRRFIAAVERGTSKPGPLVVVSHSMGTIISYDCLKHVSETPGVDGLITLGSPLGLSEVQDGFAEGWSAETGFPDSKVPPNGWLNFYDRLDIVCALDPRLSGDYRLRGDERVRDVRVRNSGSWRHYIREYLARDQVRNTLKQLLGVA